MEKLSSLFSTKTECNLSMKVADDPQKRVTVITCMPSLKAINSPGEREKERYFI
jgi:hypothetical protein